MEEERLVTGGFKEQEDEQEKSLRPKTLTEYVGQQVVKDSLNIYIQAARERHDSLDHILLYGPPGLGKTTLAAIVAAEMGQNIRVTSGPAIEKTAFICLIITRTGALCRTGLSDFQPFADSSVLFTQNQTHLCSALQKP